MARSVAWLMVLFFLCLSGITQAAVYVGTFTFPPQEQAGTVVVTLDIENELADGQDVTGRINFSNSPEKPPFCFAGSFQGTVIELSFTLNGFRFLIPPVRTVPEQDPNPGCEEAEPDGVFVRIYLTEDLSSIRGEFFPSVQTESGEYEAVRCFPTELDIVGVADDVEETEGGFLGINNDDDNSNEIEDLEETNNPSEDDLLRLSIDFSISENDGNTIHLQATSGGDNIKVWDSATKENEIVLPASWPVNISAGQQPPETLFVEGISTGELVSSQAILELSSSGSAGMVCNDRVKINLCQSERNIQSINSDACIQIRNDPNLGCLIDDGNSFNPDFWNDNEGPMQTGNNCYAYAMNKPTDTFPQPGNGGEMPIESDLEITCKGIVERANADAGGGLSILSDCKSLCPSGGRRIALVVDPLTIDEQMDDIIDYIQRDYHWYREHQGEGEDSIWSHKPGNTPVVTTDGSGNAINDPSKANHDYTDRRGPKYEFCSCLCTSPKCDEKIE